MADVPNNSVQVAKGPPCPTCGRTLLTTRSALCNWCGAVIKDEAYQQRAAEERALQDAELQQQLRIEQMENARLGVLGRLKKNRKPGHNVDPLV